MDRVLPPVLTDALPGDTVVGLTTTVPVEVIFAAGLTPVDLNNLFIASPDPLALAAEAERHGFPRTCCCWTKGIYGAVRAHGIGRVLGVSRGDCSNAEALLEVLQHEGVTTLRFDYPTRPDAQAMQSAIEGLAAELGTDADAAERWRRRLGPAREAAAEVDRLTWQQARVHGLENHLWLVSTSDFCTDPESYLAEAKEFIRAARSREPIAHDLRLGVCGIPPIVPELFDFLEALGALVVFNETPRQFAMPRDAQTLAEQYTRYTYPYGVFGRIEDIRTECRRRRLDGLIHYVQSFCHRRIEDRILRDELDLPVLTLEADQPEPLEGQLRTRLEAFVQMLNARKGV
ncbi:MAG: 2-hydroxyacyl-CoA dehydratase [Candidatus Brocadiia bacterium]